MWFLREQIVAVDPFPCRAWVTTVDCGDMKDEARRRAVSASQGIDAGRLTLCRQVHGTRVGVVETSTIGAEMPETDALITALPGVPLGVFTADCVPVFVAAKNGLCGGVIHAGWRGMAAGIISAAVRAIGEQFGVRPSDLVAAVGPHIQPCCYTVSVDLLKLFSQAGPTLDLGRAALDQLRACGITAIDVCGRCTHHETDLFYSYRRNHTDARMLSVLAL